MIDVHAPEHGIHNVREFFLHLFTITCGLLIALGLEAGVEAMHHRHQREQAETKVRQEIQNNRQQILNGADGLKAEIASMTHTLDLLEAASAGQTIPGAEVSGQDLQFQEGPLQDSAWQTAGSTGVLSYMNYSEVEQFSNAYKEQAQLQAMEELTLNDYLQLVPILAHHPGDLTPERAKEALPYARNAIGHLSGLYFIGRGMLGADNEALK